MKAIRNKLIFKAFQAKEAAREKGLMLKGELYADSNSSYHPCTVCWGALLV